MKKRLLFMTFLLPLSIALNAQVGINTAGPDASSMLDISSSNKGLLIPRVELQSTTDVISIATPANSLLVFNTVALGDVSVGYYYWSTPLSKWIKIIDQQGQSNTFGTFFATFKNDKFTVVSSPINSSAAFTYFNGGFNSIAGSSLGTSSITLPPGNYSVESSVYLLEGSFDYILRVNGAATGLKGTMAVVKNQIDVIQQKQIAVFTTTGTSTIDFIAVEIVRANYNPPSTLNVNPNLSYLKITKF
jgi:hypothetical protein